MDANPVQTCGKYKIFSLIYFTCKPDANLTFAKNLHAKQTYCKSEICYQLRRDTNLLQMSGLKNVCTRHKAVANIVLPTCLQWVCTHRLYGTHHLCNKFTQNANLKFARVQIWQTYCKLGVCYMFAIRFDTSKTKLFAPIRNEVSN